jgi:hypothetical protein
MVVLPPSHYCQVFRQAVSVDGQRAVFGGSSAT